MSKETDKDFRDGMDQGYEESIMTILEGYSKLPPRMAHFCFKKFKFWIEYYEKKVK